MDNEEFEELVAKMQAIVDKPGRTARDQKILDKYIDWVGEYLTMDIPDTPKPVNENTPNNIINLREHPRE